MAPSYFGESWTKERFKNSHSESKDKWISKTNDHKSFINYGDDCKLQNKMNSQMSLHKAA